ncbi:MAG TPA: ABC transporter substrate-binding protein [Acidimicrobiia bacterium]|nr:ABC transporter substrate-binding protein [Acidimicrobiia bacterium]
MVQRRRGWRATAVSAALALAVGAVLLAPTAAVAQTSQDATDGTRTLTVAQTSDLDPNGQSLQVDGAGYDDTKGIYVALCVMPPAGQAPGACGGIGAAGAAWVSSNPPSYGGGLATPYGPGGTFSVSLSVSPTIGTADCRAVQCAVVTRNDHTRTGDRSQDLLVPVRFAGGADTLAVGAPTPSADATKADTVPIQPVASRPKPKLPVTVKSDDGRRVKVTDVSRVVALNGSLAEILYTVGLGDHLVGRDVSTTFSEAGDVPLVTRGHDVSAESVLSRRPTLVLAQDDTGPPEALQQIRDAGVPVVVFEPPTTVAGIGEREVAVARALGVPAAGETLRARTRAQLRHLKAGISSKKPRVAFLYMRGQAGVYLIGGKGSGADSMIQAAGGIDAGTAMGLDEPFTPITSEALAKAAPEVILMTTTGLESVGGIDGLVKIPGIAQTPAGKNRRVITEEDGLLFSFGSRTPVALAHLIEDLHQDEPSKS